MTTPPEAVVLAGGLGTRLGHRTRELPKVMLPVGGRPFLAWVLDELDGAGIQRVVLAVGHRADVVRAGIGTRHAGLSVAYSVEEQPLGTGGAVVRAAGGTTSDEVLVLNGDTFVRLGLEAMLAAHRRGADLTVGVRRLDDVTRYGAVEVADGRVVGFAEKTRSGPGWANAGAYLADRRVLEIDTVPPFSFELCVIAPLVARGRVAACRLDGPWVDIGVPDDLAGAEHVLAAERTARR